MLKRIYCAACMGVEAITVTVEVDVSAGICFHLVGLPDSAVRESQQRINTALNSIGAKIPGKRIVINMAPADLRKEGSAFDLAIAIGILAASEQHLFINTNRYMIMGELALDGSLRPISGALPIAEHARKEGFLGCILPRASAYEAAEIDGLLVYGANNIAEVVSILQGVDSIDPIERGSYEEGVADFSDIPDFSEIKGQEGAKRALEIAAAGGHNILLCGSPGVGKTLMAKAFAGILPKMSRQESVETSKIYSIVGKGALSNGLIKSRPFRAPHHSASKYAIIGGGVNAQPGEISLAHNGVLYLDEIAEFPRGVLEMLRQPMEERLVSISRLRYKIEYPANFMLVASMNPCPCGFHGFMDDRCVCSEYQIFRYRSRLSGPLLDRMDLLCNVYPVPADLLTSNYAVESSIVIRERIEKARAVQSIRFNGKMTSNSQMGIKELKEYCVIGKQETLFLTNAIERLKISARSYSRILKVSRTIADLDLSKDIKIDHIAEAIQFRFNIFDPKR